MVFTTEDTEDTEHLISPRLGVRYFFFNRKGPKGIAMGRKGRIDRNKLPQDTEGTVLGNFKFDL